MTYSTRLSVLIFSALISFCIPAFAQNALNFDGTDDYAQTTFPGISGNGARTVEAWVRTTADCVPTSGGRQQVIADWGTFVTGGRSTFCLLWGNSVRFEAGGNGLSGSTAVNDGAWHHVAMTYDPLATNSVKLYIDGQLETEGNLTVAVNTVQGTNMQVGMRIDGVNNFTGDIDEVRVWNIARTAAEISGNMNAEFCQMPSGLAVYYKANNGVAGGNNAGLTNLDNEVSSNYNGTLTNFALNGASSNWITGSGITSGETSSSFQESACNQYIAPSGAVFDTTGIYTDIIPNAAGCDSVMTIDVDITEVDVNVTDNGDQTLTADQGGAFYQWLSCTQGFAPVSGATNQTFVPTQIGQYAVEITYNGCVDTSNCYNITSIGITESGQELIEVYPNPAVGRLHLRATQNGRVSIFDATGRLVYQSLDRGLTREIGVEDWSSGNYVLRFKTASGVYTRSIQVR